MKLKLISVCARVPNWVEQGFQEYTKRLPPQLSLQLHEVPLRKRHGSGEHNQQRAAEEKAIIKLINRQDHVITLDRRGKHWDTEQLSQQLANWQTLGQDICLLIGGPEGLSTTCLERANQSWALSPLTFPHALVRVIVAEQLYRASTILSGHPYHR